MGRVESDGRQLRAILIDDERLALEVLERRLRAMGQVVVVGKEKDPCRGLELIRREQVDVVFLDIHMPGISGLELAERLLAAKPRLHIVFVTAYDHFAVQAMEMYALDYMLKPVNLQRLAATTARVRESIDSLSPGAGKAVQSLPADPVKLCLLGGLKLEYENGQRKPMNWRTDKARELFAYVLHHRGTVVRRVNLVELLWPNEAPLQAYRYLYLTAYHVRQALLAYGVSLSLVYMPDGYELRNDGIPLDVEEWERIANDDRPLTEESVLQFRDKLEQHSEPYFQLSPYAWSRGEQRRLEQLWIRAAMRVARWYELRGTEQAIAVYEWIRERRPLAAGPYLALMRLYAASDNRAAADRLYRQRLEAMHHEEAKPETAGNV